MQAKTSSQTESVNYSNKIWTLPNVLSFLRLALVPIICLLYFIKQDGVAAAVLLAVSALTDVVDGMVARKYNMISDLGKALDPIADKLTQAVVLVCLVVRFPYMLGIFALLVVKEVVTGAVSLYVTKKTGTVNGAVWHGKLTTVLLYSTMFLHLVWHNIPDVLSYVLAALCVVMMLISFILYAVRNKQMLNKHK